MADLTSARRNALTDAMFGQSAERKYPMPDKSHARNAKARPSEERAKGKLTSAQERKIDAKANRILYGSAKHGSARVNARKVR